MEEMLRQILDGQNRMDSRLDRIETRLSGVEDQIAGINVRLTNVEGQLQESNGFIKSLVHQSEYQKAKMDEFTHTIARIEGQMNQGFAAIEERFTSFEKEIKAVGDDVGFLARKVFSHDDIIRNLKIAK